MTTFKWFASFVLAATIVSTLSAETHCPGNVASVPFRFVNRHQMIVAVSVNHFGPYNFLLDTGTQITMVDPSLAVSLHLATQGTAEVVSVGMHASASFARLDLLETGSHSVSQPEGTGVRPKESPGNRPGNTGRPWRGFSRAVRYVDRQCAQTALPRRSGHDAHQVKGTHVPLEIPASTTDDATLPKPLIVVTRLSDGRRPIRLKLDSGTNISFLYNTDEYMALGLFRGASLHGGASGSQRTFMALPPQNVRIGSVEIQKVPFTTLVGAQKDSRTSNFDGLLTMGLFRQIFIDHADHFAVLQPW